MFLRWLIVVLFPVMLEAQVYYVGTPVYDTLYSSTVVAQYDANQCPSVRLTIYMNLQQNPTGTQVYLKIIGGTMAPNTLHDTAFGMLNIGDSIIANDIPSADYHFYSTDVNGSQFQYAFIRTGIPTVVNDSFHCAQDLYGSSSFMTDACHNFLTNNYFGIGTGSCTVNGPLATEELERIEIRCVPNPSDGIFNFTLQKTLAASSVYEIVDVTGRIICSRTLDAGEINFSIDLGACDPGMYLLKIRGENGQMSSTTLLLD
jgi:hypothetical protein